MSRIYVASSWRCERQPMVVSALRQNGHEVYDFRYPTVDYDNANRNARGFHWSEIDPNWKSWGPSEYVKALDHPLAHQGFESDWQAMEWADTCVLVLPSGRSAHLEAGCFVGAGKSLHILLAEQQEPELMYRMATAVHLSLYGLLSALCQWPALA